MAHVASGTAVVRVAASVGLEIDIETGDFDHTDAVIVTLLVEFHYRRLGGLIFEFHRLAQQGHFAAGHVTGRVAGGNHFQAYRGAFRTADQLDHLVQAPTNHIDHFTLVLGNTDDAVGGGELLAL